MPMPSTPVRTLLLAVCLCGAAALARAELLWFEAGRPTPDAMHAAQVLAAAAEHGLDPADYAGRALQSRLAAAAQAPAAAAFKPGSYKKKPSQHDTKKKS